MVPEQMCRQCGRCCERWGWGQKGTAGDLVPWIEADRQDILQHVTIYLKNGRKVSGTEISEEDIPDIMKVKFWQDPNGRPLRHCPFLRRSGDGKAFCGIHSARPAICREYAPWNCDDSDYQYVRCQACRDRMP
ncbi:MAG: YkgJ family cysteine cluster protein [Methanolinea sp.]|nr:YkgJ family cysteine cluster protein [Methanolinea sp.]